MSHYDKPYKTYPEMLNILRSRNVIVDDDRTGIEILKNYSYYSIANINKDIFCQSDDYFKDGTHINHLYQALIAQKGFCNILLKYIIYFEIAFKSRIAEQIASKIGVEHQDSIYSPNENYLYYKHYSSSLNRRKNICQSLVNRSKELKVKAPNTSTYYYRKTKNHLPPWILIRDIPFGLAIEWYNILRGDQKENIVLSLLSSHSAASARRALSIQHLKEFFKFSVKLLKECRNAIAHGDRPYPYKLKTSLPKIPLSRLTGNAITHEMYDSEICNRDYLAVLTSLLLLLPDAQLRSTMVREIEAQIDTYGLFDYGSNTIYEILSLPSDIIRVY